MSKDNKNYSKLAADILAIVGKDNVVSVTHCATRLRLVLKESPDKMKQDLSYLPDVITVNESGEQLQIVIGTQVSKVYDEFMNDMDADGASNRWDGSSEKQDKRSILGKIIETMSAVFAPFIYILAASGIIQGALIIVTTLYPSFSETGTYQVFSFISWASFTFLPIFIAITASRYFKVNTYIAVACCAAIVSPTWTEMAGSIASGRVVTFFNIPLSETVYTSSVLPPLLLVWGLSYLEAFLEKKIPEIIRQIAVPMICLVITVPLTILILGPISASVASWIADGYNFLAENIPFLAGTIVGGLWQPLVIFGVHWGVLPVVIANFDMYGRDSFQAFQTISVIAQMGAVLGVYIKSRDKKTKNIALPAAVTSIFGITEPAIYGVNLRLKKPFIFACISGGIGAIVASLFHPYYYAYAGLPGILTIVNAISPKNPNSFTGILIGSAIALIGPVILLQIFGTGEIEIKEDVSVDGTNNESNNKENKKMIFAPVSGKVIPLNKIPDEVFSTGAMGQGVAIEPNTNQVLAPFSGKVTAIFGSKHAIGLTSDDGIEILIHVGLDTVNLHGKNFDYFVKQDQMIKQGAVLLSFDPEKIKTEGYPVTTMVIVTNSDQIDDLTITEKDLVTTDNVIIEYK